MTWLKDEQSTDENQHDFPKVFTACAVTRAMAKARSEPVLQKCLCNSSHYLGLIFLCPYQFVHVDLIAEQQADP